MVEFTREEAEIQAERVVEGRTREILGRRADHNAVTDILWMIANAVGYARQHAESERFGPDHEVTLAFRRLAEKLQRGL